jgi:hypothetical protein
MIQVEEPADRIRRANNLIAAAAERWNAGDPAALEQCLSALEESVVELHAAEGMASGNPGSLHGFGEEIRRMKTRVAGIERMSDLASAFLRGTQATEDSPLYRSGGFEATPDLSYRATTTIQA